MKRPILALLILFLCIGPLSAQISSTTEKPMVDWLILSRPSNKKQTSAEEEAGRSSGRDLPTPEILQPTLDPALASYRPRLSRKLTKHLRGACADTMPALVRLWIAGFKKYYPNIEIEVPPPYDGPFGAKELANGNLDFTVISRVLRPEEVAAFQSKFGYDPLSVPVSIGSYRHFGFLDAMGFFVNKDNPLERISFDQLDAMLARTHHRGSPPITTWGQLGLTGEWADKPIHIYGIKPWDGIEALIRERVLNYDGKRGEWRADINFDSVFNTARRVNGDRYGFGYTGLSYIDAGVRVLALGESANGPFYAPTYENVALNRYPLNRVIFFNANRPPTKPLDPVLAEFLSFILSREGQQIVRDHAVFLPLSAAQAANSQTLLQ